MTIPTQLMLDGMVHLLDDCKATQVAVTFVMTAHSWRTTLVRHSTLLDGPEDNDAGALGLDVPDGLVVEVKDHAL